MEVSKLVKDAKIKPDYYFKDIGCPMEAEGNVYQVIESYRYHQIIGPTVGPVVRQWIDHRAIQRTAMWRLPAQ